jgi:hypothetical protein
VLETNIHGRFELPPGYVLAVVPRDSKFVNDIPYKRGFWRTISDSFSLAPQGDTKISCGYGVVKILVAIIQLLYATATLYLARGDQVEWYGYPAFGLTVAPYAWM